MPGKADPPIRVDLSGGRLAHIVKQGRGKCLMGQGAKVEFPGQPLGADARTQGMPP